MGRCAIAWNNSPRCRIRGIRQEINERDPPLFHHDDDRPIHLSMDRSVGFFSMSNNSPRTIPQSRSCIFFDLPPKLIHPPSQNLADAGSKHLIRNALRQGAPEDLSCQIVLPTWRKEALNALLDGGEHVHGGVAVKKSKEAADDFDMFAD